MNDEIIHACTVQAEYVHHPSKVLIKCFYS